jgi:hypothetical protein
LRDGLGYRRNGPVTGDAPGRIRTSDQRLRRPPLFH